MKPEQVSQLIAELKAAAARQIADLTYEVASARVMLAEAKAENEELLSQIASMLMENPARRDAEQEQLRAAAAEAVAKAV